ncbi:MAG TPA: HAMP domain-containing sensor histidine kinase [Bryobacteraceae bacterium]|nr:HAMP domain-containing sensor histidine kinase [Bryobacteraceae bacterium]
MSLRWKIWLSMFGMVSGLFGVAGWLLQRHALESATLSLEEEVQAGFQAYESVLRARQEMIGSAALLLSSLPNVRAAFGTGDPATIRDSASEIGAYLSPTLKESTFWVVTDPRGATIAVLSGAPKLDRWPVDAAVVPTAPRQVSGYHVQDGKLFRLVLTPVFVDSARGPALISLLVAGYPVNDATAAALKQSTGGSDFVFSSAAGRFAATVEDIASDDARIERDLAGLDGAPVGKLTIARTFGAAGQRLDRLRLDLLLMWAASLGLSLLLGYLLANRLVRPISELDRAAAELSRQHFSHRIPGSVADAKDEFGRLAAAFNQMAGSLEEARRELIRHERIATVGRLASSIVHDLRNPLAAIYSGAEMMVDSELPPAQNRRLAVNIYKASRRILAMLQELLDSSKGKPGEREACHIVDLVQAAVQAQEASAGHIQFAVDVPGELEATVERTRMERVFLNLVANAVEVMPNGGVVKIRAGEEDGQMHITVADEGPGIAKEMQDQLFQPFASFGKRNGLGLGLALSRETVVDHGGEIWATPAAPRGAVFHVKLPLH